MKIQTNRDFYNFLLRCFLPLAISLLTLSYSVAANAAEYVYISDNLRVGVRPDPVSGVPPISVVFTGMRLELHEKSDGYVRITTEKGVSGWIRDIYVTKKAPAIIQLNAFKLKYDKLKKELEEGGGKTAALEKEKSVLVEKIDELKAERSEWAKERTSLMASQYEESSLFWIIGMLILIGLSFTVGIFWYKKHVMKRLGGLRV